MVKPRRRTSCPAWKLLLAVIVTTFAVTVVEVMGAGLRNVAVVKPWNVTAVPMIHGEKRLPLCGTIVRILLVT